MKIIKRHFESIETIKFPPPPKSKPKPKRRKTEERFRKGRRENCRMGERERKSRPPTPHMPDP